MKFLVAAVITLIAAFIGALAVVILLTRHA
jgi:hypothetical protein